MDTGARFLMCGPDIAKDMGLLLTPETKAFRGARGQSAARSPTSDGGVIWDTDHPKLLGVRQAAEANPSGLST